MEKTLPGQSPECRGVLVIVPIDGANCYSMAFGFYGQTGGLIGGLRPPLLSPDISLVTVPFHSAKGLGTVRSQLLSGLDS